jgi:hypothetical protein
METQQNGGVIDKAGVKRVTIGQLPNGDYGILLADAAGATTELLPVYSGQLTGSVATSAGSYADLGFPAVTASIGASGKVKVTASSTITITPSAAGVWPGIVGVSIDGATPTGILSPILSGSLTTTGAGGSVVSASASVVVPGIAPGSHTFKLLYSSGVAVVSFSESYLQIEPI